MFNRKDYTARDYASIIAQVKQYIAVEYPELTLSFAKMSPEQLFLDMTAFISDANHLYTDAGFSEFFLDTFAERQNGISLGKWVGYSAPMLSAPSAEVDYTFTGPGSENLPRGTTVKDRKGNSWTTIETQTMESEGGTFVFYQGVFVTDTFAGTSKPNQEFRALRPNIASNVSAYVQMDGTDASQTDSLLSCEDEYVYEVEYKTDKSASFRFGDGVNGNLASASVTLQYLTTRGLAGRVDAKILRGTITLSTGVVTFSNPVRVTNGGDVVSVETIRRGIPAYVSSLNTLVTKEDYQGMIDNYPGIQLSSVTFDPMLRQNVYYIMSTAFGMVPDYTVSYLNQLYKPRYQINSSGVFKNISYASILLSLKVFLESNLDTQKGTITSEINSKILRFFRPEESDIRYCQTGKPIRLSDIYGMIENIQGVSFLEVTVFTRKPEITPVNYTEYTNDIDLESWALRPVFRLNEQNSSGISSNFIGTMTPSDIGHRPIQLISHTTASDPGLGSHEDWKPATGMVPLEKISLKMTNSNGLYSWAGWSDASTEVQELLLTYLGTKFYSTQTAHFKVTTVIDSKPTVDIGLGYLGLPYQNDSGSFNFKLNTQASDLTVTDESITLDENLVGVTYKKNIRPDSITGTITGASGGLVFDKDGTLRLVLGSAVGLVDYDKGIVVLEPGYTAVTLSYSYMVFDNRDGDECQIILSPYSHTIALAPHEYPILHTLDLEVGIE